MPFHFSTPDRSPMAQVNIQNLIDDTRCYQTVRELRWPNGIQCPSCESQHVIKRGFDAPNRPVNAMSVTTVTNALMI
jgi:hypothetical protein